MKITKVILLALAIGLINSTFGDPIETGRNLIVPGVRLGEVSLGHTVPKVQTQSLHDRANPATLRPGRSPLRRPG